MNYNIYKPNSELILNELKALEGLFVFPSISYESIEEKNRTFSLECILISYSANNNDLFKTSFLKHIARLDEYTFYAILETDILNEEKFDWDNIPGKESTRFIRFLKDDLEINWLENNNIIITNNIKTIRFVSEEKSVEISLDESKQEALLRINDGQAFNRFYNLKLKKEKGKFSIYGKRKISPSTYIINFITSLNYIPFFITNGNILIYKENENGETIEDNRYGDISRYVANGQFNPFLIIIDRFAYNINGTENQIKKFENALIALRWIINFGFPYKKIIDWEKNRIIDDDVKKKLRTSDVPFDTYYIEGNREYRFCRLIRFCLKEILSVKRDLFVKLLNLNLIDPISSLYFFELIKKPITDVYISDVQSSSNIFKHMTHNLLKKPEVFSPAFIISMRISQPEGFTEKFLQEKKKHPTIFGGLSWEIEPVKTITRGKQRYEIYIYAGKRINILDLSTTLDDITKIFTRLLINSGLDTKYLTSANIQFWLRYLEITIPIINNEITTACVDMFNRDFGTEQIYARKFKKIYNPKEDEFIFRLGFLSKLTLDRFLKDKRNEDRMNRSDPFTKAAIYYALSGNHRRGFELLYEIDRLLEADRDCNTPSRFYYYIMTYEKDLICFLTERHPMSFMSDKNYNILKNDVKFFLTNYHDFKNLEELIGEGIESKNKIEYVDRIDNKLKYMGIYKEKDMSYLDTICIDISMFFAAQYRKVFCFKQPCTF